MQLIKIDFNSEELLLAIRSEVSKCISEHLARPEENALLTRRQLKNKYGLSYSTIHRYVSKGILIPSRIGGKVYFDQKQINETIIRQIGK